MLSEGAPDICFYVEAAQKYKGSIDDSLCLKMGFANERLYDLRPKRVNKNICGKYCESGFLTTVHFFTLTCMALDKDLHNQNLKQKD